MADMATCIAIEAKGHAQGTSWMWIVGKWTPLPHSYAHRPNGESKGADDSFMGAILLIYKNKARESA